LKEFTIKDDPRIIAEESLKMLGQSQFIYDMVQRKRDKNNRSSQSKTFHVEGPDGVE
jgi:hypothetical protein